jgi:hypothetical protein
MLERPPRRIRFLACEVERSGDRFRARVDLADADTKTVTGTAEREAGPDGDLWCTADATVAALRQVLSLGAAALTLREVVLFDIEGKPAVAVSLRAYVQGQRRRLFGLTEAEADRGRSAALAVLNATNRFFSSG